MQAFTKFFLLAISISCLTRISSSQCLRYDQSQCVQWVGKQNAKVSNESSKFVQIKQKPSNSSQLGSTPSQLTNNSSNSMDYQRKLNNNFSLSGFYQQPVNISVISPTNLVKVNSQDNSSNLVKVLPYNYTQDIGRIKAPSISIDDIRQFSSQSVYIKNIYNNYSQLVLLYALNKISLELFEFSRATAFDKILDPVLQLVLQNIQNIYGSTLKNQKFFAAFFKYSAFAKIYKIFYVDQSQIESLKIDQVDAIVDLFHMQVFTSCYKTYCTILFNQSTIQSLQNSTKTN